MKTITYYLLVLLLLIYPLGQLEKIPLGIPAVSVYFHDIVVVFILVAGALAYRHCLEEIFSLPLFFPLLSFELFAVLSLLLNPLNLSFSDWLVASSYFVRFTAYAALYPLIALQVKKKLFLGYQLLKLLFLTGGLIAILGLSQYFLYPNLRNLYYLGWDPHQYRLFSTFLDPNFTGLILVLTILLGLAFLLEDREDLEAKSYKKLVRISKILLVFIALVALILTYSRSSYLTLTISLPISLLHQRRLKLVKWLILFYVLFFFTMLLLPRPFGEGVRLERTSTIQSRIRSYQQATEIIKKYPFFGVGFNAYRYAQREMGNLPQAYWQKIHSGSGADNSFLFAWATAGLGGLLSLIWLLYKGIVLNKGIIKPQGFYEGLVTASLLSVGIHSFFVNSFFYPWVLLWLWIILGVEEGFRVRR